MSEHLASAFGKHPQNFVALYRQMDFLPAQAYAVV